MSKLKTQVTLHLLTRVIEKFSQTEHKKVSPLQMAASLEVTMKESASAALGDFTRNELINELAEIATGAMAGTLIAISMRAADNQERFMEELNKFKAELEAAHE